MDAFCFEEPSGFYETTTTTAVVPQTAVPLMATRWCLQENLVNGGKTELNFLFLTAVH